MAPKTYDLASKHLVLLPGLDGTGDLFAGFLATLPRTLSVTVVRYPTDKFLRYSELVQLVSASITATEPFVVLAESFSTPVALKYAATAPANLSGVVICAGFASNPIPGWSRIARIIARPWVLTLSPPRKVVEHFLLGKGASPDLISKFRQTLRRVPPATLSARVREALDCSAHDDLARITVPMLYLCASHDRLLSASCLNEFLRIRPGTRLVTIDAPHMLVQREPQKVADLVLEFMTNS